MPRGLWQNRQVVFAPYKLGSEPMTNRQENESTIQSTDVPDLITFEHAAKILGIGRHTKDKGRRTIERLCERGKLRTYKRPFGVRVGRHPRLLSRADVQALATSVELVCK